VNKINQGHRLDLDLDSAKTSCTYSFDLNEPQLKTSPDTSRDWIVNWFIHFHSAADKHDLELSWSFIPNKFVDAGSGSIQLPRSHGFIISDLSRGDFNSIDNLDELYFSFESTHINRNYRVYFEVDGHSEKAALAHTTHKFLSQKYLTYLNKRINKYELINTNIYSKERPFKLDELGVNSIRVKRNGLHSVEMSFKLDQNVGDCDFDASVCGFVANSFPVETNSVFSLPHIDSLLISHAPKYPFINTNDHEMDKKARDFYLSITKSKREPHGVLYSPLIRVQPTRSNLDSWNAYNQKIFSISFKYSSSSLTDSIELILLQNRSDIQNVTRNFGLQPIHGLFSSNSINAEHNKRVFRVWAGEDKTCAGVNNQEQFVEWSKKRSSDSTLQNWYEVRKLSFYSCYDFRVGFTFAQADTLDNSESVSQFGLDDVQLNVEETLLGLCGANICQNNGRCFMFEEAPVCCCPPGFRVS
jgi:hypothetical protein